MAKVNIVADAAQEHKSKFIRFTPTLSVGNILTALAIVASGVSAWVQLNNQVGNLATATEATAKILAAENLERKNEIKDAIARQDMNRVEFYKKLADDHAETMADIKVSQQQTHDDIKEIATSLGVRFDRVEDKLDKKVDKK